MQVEFSSNPHSRECISVLVSAIETSFGAHRKSMIECVWRLSEFSPRHRFRRVALVNNTAVGFVDWHADKIDWLMVSAPFQGFGIGSELLSRAIAEMPSTVSVLCVEENLRAIRFYQRLGFSIKESGVIGKMFGETFANFVLECSSERQLTDC